MGSKPSLSALRGVRVALTQPLWLPMRCRLSVDFEGCWGMPNQAHLHGKEKFLQADSPARQFLLDAVPRVPGVLQRPNHAFVSGMLPYEPMEVAVVCHLVALWE